MVHWKKVDSTSCNLTITLGKNRSISSLVTYINILLIERNKGYYSVASNKKVYAYALGIDSK